MKADGILFYFLHDQPKHTIRGLKTNTGPFGPVLITFSKPHSHSRKILNQQTVHLSTTDHLGALECHQQIFGVVVLNHIVGQGGDVIGQSVHRCMDICDIVGVGQMLNIILNGVLGHDDRQMG